MSPKQLLYQKVVKPGVERRRRARINQSVEQLKEMLLKNNKLKCLQPRIEKADILEMTLQYIREHSVTGGSTDPDFQAGFQHCLLLTHHFLSTTGHFLSNTVSPTTKNQATPMSAKMADIGNKQWERTPACGHGNHHKAKPRIFFSFNMQHSKQPIGYLQFVPHYFLL
ncbi:transcription factor HES-7.1-like [Acipenser oxyrinchus oxyrinchus]|uniref:Transcription factor HES-7.1-like n=1 Tax=Acipenser oxyrinchus oxyrinchus TaxID=40147 RepID=A0AAD8D453_ACIOX|nr:transcription factor HES-7.1-like [Acipenser oxyrinchus oxyrinchus]